MRTRRTTRYRTSLVYQILGRTDQGWQSQAKQTNDTAVMAHVLITIKDFSLNECPPTQKMHDWADHVADRRELSKSRPICNNNWSARARVVSSLARSTDGRTAQFHISGPVSLNGTSNTSITRPHRYQRARGAGGHAYLLFNSICAEMKRRREECQG